MTSRCDDLHAELQQAIREALTRHVRPKLSTRPALLDIGCWNGATTIQYAERLDARSIHGVEAFAEHAATAREHGVDVAELDLERAPLPWPDASMDVVTCNQVFEHLKNIWLPMSEIARVLRPGGFLVFSVPNLAALHNRVALLAGVQPTCIRVPGPHVRSYTLRQIRAFLELGGVFSVVRTVGVGTWRYGWGAPLAQLLPGLSVTPVLIAQKVGAGQPWLAYTAGEQTVYQD